MRRVFRNLLVLIVAFALVASAGGWQQCAALHVTAAAADIEHGSHTTSHRVQAAGHGEHDHQDMHHQRATDDAVPPVTPAADDHGCMKCCAMCTIANALLPAVNTAVIFTVSSPMVAHDTAAWSANTVAVDPGIPKRII